MVMYCHFFPKLSSAIPIFPNALIRGIVGNFFIPTNQSRKMIKSALYLEF